MRLVYLGQFRDPSGYAIAARDYLRSLDLFIKNNPGKLELKIYSSVASRADTLTPEEKELVEKYEFKNDQDLEEFTASDFDLLWHMPPPLANFGDERFKPSPGCSPSMSKLLLSCRKKISLLAWETDIVPTEWQRAFDYYPVDKIITPSSWNTRVFSTLGVPCETVPHVVEKDDNVLPVKFPVDLENKFVILSIGQWTQRKGFDRLLSSFYSEFGDKEDVVLIIKTYGSVTDNSNTIQGQIKRIKDSIFLPGNEIVNQNNVVLIDNFLPKPYINWFYSKADVFALFTRGEGFGLPVAEAAINGLPTIVPSEGGHTDLIRNDTSFMVDGRWDTCTFRIPPYGVEGKWFETSIESGRDKLREAYNLWKHDRESLVNIGNQAEEHIRSLKIDAKSIGERLFNAVDSTQKITSPISYPTTYTKSKISKVKSLVRSLDSYEEKVSALQDSFKGDTCYILNCGPSLKHYDPEYLKGRLDNELVLAVKQAHDYCPEVVDFHLFNCSNLPFPKDGLYYDYRDSDPLVIASSNYPLGVRWDKRQHTDIFLKIPIRTRIDSFLCDNKKFDDYLLSNGVERPCGPGIMYETVIHTAVHLGVSRIVVLGWDLGGNPKSPNDYEHFYDKNSKMVNQGDILKDEIFKTREGLKSMNRWLESKGIELVIASNISTISLTIKRTRI